MNIVYINVTPSPSSGAAGVFESTLPADRTVRASCPGGRLSLVPVGKNRTAAVLALWTRDGSIETLTAIVAVTAKRDVFDDVTAAREALRSPPVACWDDAHFTAVMNAATGDPGPTAAVFALCPSATEPAAREVIRSAAASFVASLPARQAEPVLN